MHYSLQMAELRAEGQQISESSGTIGRSKGAAVASSHQQISVTVVTEFVRWNEEAITRCTLFSSQVMFVVSRDSTYDYSGVFNFYLDLGFGKNVCLVCFKVQKKHIYNYAPKFCFDSVPV